MRAYLPIFILSIGQCCFSSASFLTPIKLFEELSITNSLTASPIGSPVMSLDTSITPLSLLTGYVGYIQHKDSSCTFQMSVSVTALNICIRTQLDKYEYVIATITSVTRTEYSDSLCTVPVAISVTLYTNSKCVDKMKILIGPSFTANPSDATAYYRYKNVLTVVNPHYIRSLSNLNRAILLSRYYPLSDSSCSLAPTQISYVVLDICIPSITTSLRHTMSGICMHNYFWYLF